MNKLQMQITYTNAGTYVPITKSYLKSQFLMNLQVAEL